MSKFFIQSAGTEVSVDDIDDYIVQIGYWTLGGSMNYIYGRRGKYHRQYLHLIIAERMNLDISNDIDHIDHNIYNNQRSNLREATRSQNMMNSKIHSDNKTGYKGVDYRKDMQKYRARIQVDDRSIHLGYYDYAEQAHLYYCIAAIKYFGKFARFE